MTKPIDTRDILTLVALIFLIVHSIFLMPDNFNVLVIAIGITILWLLFYPTYKYAERNRYVLKKINVYPLVLWTTAFIIAADVHVFLFNGSLLFTVPLWITLVLFGEWVGYHVLHIRLNGNEPGLWGMNIIHGKPILHAFYIVAVPLFVYVTDVFLLR